ncbi:hypothetical protein [Comamonas koreensis]|uniref:RNA polymerase alpha subunit C-terminal domain-containing protein n=1 Tax=Comamonas koreensis TaxID=160825 RepID=A0AAW4XVV1_9BURK|nr:hypothetical protein [Comamonas koreensis]MCD2165551.1 hypothetical protein [Comamonas koreensis]
MNNIKLSKEIPLIGLKDLKDEKSTFLDNFSCRSRNALAAFEILDKSLLDYSIETGEIFRIPRLGINGIREIITWAWKNKNISNYQS